MRELQSDFVGAKVAVLWQSCVLTLLRDDRPDIPFPAHWDLPGGGREGQETPVVCALREAEEELSLRLDPGDIVWQRRYPAIGNPGETAWFFVARPAHLDLAELRLGEEGQAWRAMPIEGFLRHRNAVPYLQQRLTAYLADGATI